jgi:rhodanese-related sulfurtransferase
MGFKNAVALEGGVEAWQRAGYPMKTAAAAQRSA